MWWSNALLVTGLLLLGPVGCGFHPLYAQRDAQAPVSAELASIRVVVAPASNQFRERNSEHSLDRMGQLLRNSLVQRLNPRGEPVHAKYVLSVKFTSRYGALAQSQDDLATIGSVNMNATYSLVDISTERQVISTVSQSSILNYRFDRPSYGTVAIERDAEERAVTDLADRVFGGVWHHC